MRAVRIEPTGDDPAATPEELPCDLVVVGVGIDLDVELARAAGLEVDQRHGIVANEWLQTSARDVFVAGDVAAYLDPIVGRTHFEHWDNAIATGQTAGANMTGAGQVSGFDLSLLKRSSLDVPAESSGRETA